MVVDEFNKGFDKTKEWAEGVPLIGDALGGLISKFDHFKDIYADAIGEGLAKFDGDEAAAKSFALSFKNPIGFTRNNHH